MDELNNTVIPQPDQSWKMKTLVIGGVLGALIGVSAAYLLAKRAEEQGKTLAISPAKGVQLGVLVAGVLRSILNLGE
jgi:hypothetical protein